MSKYSLIMNGHGSRHVDVGIAMNTFLSLPLQNFYLWKKDKNTLKEIKERDKELLVEVSKSDKCRRINATDFETQSDRSQCNLAMTRLSTCRRTSVGPLSLCRTWRAFSTSEKMARSPGSSASSS